MVDEPHASSVGPDCNGLPYRPTRQGFKEVSYAALFRDGYYVPIVPTGSKAALKGFSEGDV